MADWDLLVVGGGIAGCCVAWQAHWRGLRVAVIDAGDENTASRVAAGLVTPLTGSRLSPSWRWNEFFPAAQRFYDRVQQAIGEEVWRIAPAQRWFLDAQECDFFKAKRQGDANVAKMGIQWRELSPSPDPIAANWGGLEMSPAARLDTQRFLNGSRAYLESRDAWHELVLNGERDLQFNRAGVEVAPLGDRAQRVVYCQGVQALDNGWFQALPLHPARGDILEIQSRREFFSQVVHHQAWAVPMGMGRYLLGATYDRDWRDIGIDHERAVHGAHTLLERWKAMTGESLAYQPQDILSHRAGIRPASYDRHPLIGPHPHHPRMACLNGLGSKGSLMAPHLAAMLLDLWLEERVFDPALVWHRRLDPTGTERNQK